MVLSFVSEKDKFDTFESFVEVIEDNNVLNLANYGQKYS